MSEGWLDENLVPHKRPDTEALKNRKTELAQIASGRHRGNLKLAPKGPIGPHDPRKWTAISYVTEGRYGVISLWAWKGTPNEKNAGRYVILKTELEGAFGRKKFDLSSEGRLMAQLIAQQRTDHLVTMVYQGNDYHKLYLEFCFNGTLQKNILWRIKQGKRNFYSEEHLWRWFMCLVKGSRSLGGEHLRKNGDKSLPIILHLDLKPENILLGDVEDWRNTDLERPTCRGGYEILKIGDFGHAWSVETDAVPVRDPEDPEGELRKRFKQPQEIGDSGTPGYHPPEQRLVMEKNPKFSLDWKFADFWNRWEVAYGYSSKTNIWGIGVIMWQLICLSELSPLLQDKELNHNRFLHTIDRPRNDMWPWDDSKFRRTFTEPSKGKGSVTWSRENMPKVETYGPEINDPEVKARYPRYNGLLIDLVLICLSEHPRSRPSNSELFDIVGKVCKEYDKETLGPDPSEDKSAPGCRTPKSPLTTTRDGIGGRTITKPKTQATSKGKDAGKEKDDSLPSPPTRKGSGKGSNNPSLLSKDPLRSPKTEILPPDPDGALRTWTLIPGAHLVPDPMLPPSNASTANTPNTPNTPNTTLPPHIRPYLPPPSPTSPKSVAAAITRSRQTPTAATEQFQSIYGSSPRVGSPRSPRSQIVSATSRNRGGRSKKGEEKSVGKEKERKRPKRRVRVSSIFCIPIYDDCLGVVMWLMFFNVAIFMTAFCLFYTMLVEYEKLF